MEMEQAFRLSDFYILKLDYLNAVEDIVALHDKMVLDFTGKMRLLRKNAGTSKPITACLDYIYIHIKERITIEDLLHIQTYHQATSPVFSRRKSAFLSATIFASRKSKRLNIFLNSVTTA